MTPTILLGYCQHFGHIDKNPVYTFLINLFLFIYLFGCFQVLIGAVIIVNENQIVFILTILFLDFRVGYILLKRLV